MSATDTRQGRNLGIPVDPKDDFDRWITEREHDGRHRTKDAS